MAELRALGVAADRHRATCTVPGALEIGVALAALAASDELRRADRARLRHPRRDLPLRARRQRERRRGHARRRSTTACRSPTPSSPRERGAGRGPRRGQGPRRRPRRRSRWRTCWTSCRERSRPARRRRRRRRHRARAAAARRRPRAAPKSARRRAREFALQGLYEWLLGGADAGVVDAHVREQDGFEQVRPAALRPAAARLHPRARRPRRACWRPTSTARSTQLSPIEHAVLLIGSYELHALHRHPVQGGDQRGGRAGEELRRHRRPQVRQRRARQGRGRAAHASRSRRPAAGAAEALDAGKSPTSGGLEW